jgi:hypothetical protein
LGYRGIYKVKFFGKIEPDGLVVDMGVYGERKVHVTCVDYMGEIYNHRLDLLQPTTNVTSGQAAALVIANIPRQPLQTYYNGNQTLTYVFDSLSDETAAASELNKLVYSCDLPYCYLQHKTNGEIFTFSDAGENYYIPNTTTLTTMQYENSAGMEFENGDVMHYDETEEFGITDADIIDGTGKALYGAELANDVTVISYPREIDAAATTVLWTLQTAMAIEPGTPITIRGRYSDPTGGNTKINGKDIVRPLVAGTDYKANAAANGTGADKTANLSVTVTEPPGAQEVELTLNNTSAATIYTGGETAGAFLKVTGKAIRLFDPVRITKRDAFSISTYGKYALVVDRRYSDNPQNDITFCQGLLDVLKDPARATIGGDLKLCANKDERNLYAFLYAEPHTTVYVSETVTGLQATDYFFLNGYSYEMQGAGIVFWNPILKVI